MRVIEPLGSFMHIRILEKKNVEQETPGGLVLPAKASEAPRVAEVLAVGPGLYNPMGSTPETMYFKPKINVGDLIYFLQNGPVQVVHPQFAKEAEVTHMIAEGDVLGIYMRNYEASELGLVDRARDKVAEVLGV